MQSNGHQEREIDIDIERENVPTESEFDVFADEYTALHTRNIALSGEGSGFFAAYKVADVADLCRREGIVPQAILDFGAGIGNSVPFFRSAFPDAEIVCADVSEKSLAVAAQRFPGQARLVRIEDALPFEDASFDLVFTACVFHHIPPEDHAAVLLEQKRVLRPGGRLVIFEHNPMNPLTVHAVNTCPLDANAILIRASVMAARLRKAGLAVRAVRYRLFFPHCLRALRRLEPLLTSVPLGAQYYIEAATA